MGTWSLSTRHPELFCAAGSFSGMPAVPVSTEDLSQICDQIRQQPSTVFTLDLQKKLLSFLGASVKVEMSEEKRKAFLDGIWDTLPLLKANREAVLNTAKSLPYIS